MCRNTQTEGVFIGDEEILRAAGGKKEARTVRLVVSAGGTGGHINPALVIAGEFKKRGHAVLFVGGKRGPEKRKVEEAGIGFIGIDVLGFDRSSPLRLAKALVRLPFALVRAFKTVMVFSPHAVIGVGGYASGPSCIAALFQSVPLFLMEQNVYPGLVTRTLAGRARRVFTSFAESEKYLPSANCVYAGNPTRGEFHPARRDYAGKDEMTLLVMGGSQGARSINRAMARALPLLSDMRLKVFHQTGAGDYKEIKSVYEKHMPGAVVQPHFDNMAELMRTADFAVSRAGASTCAELTISALPALLIPYPGAGGHQKLNARVLEENGAVKVIEDDALDGELLAQTVRDLLKDRASLERMSANSLEMARPDAAKIIARDIIEILENQ